MEFFFNFPKGDYVRGSHSQGCILCRLCENDPEIPNLCVLSTELFAVSVNLYPFNPGHLLVYPLRHTEDIRDLTPEEDLELQSIRNSLLDALDTLYSPHAYNIGFNMGRVAGASIPHIHLHIIPRYPNEIGIPELMGGKRVLVEDPRETRQKLIDYFERRPFSMRST